MDAHGFELEPGDFAVDGLGHGIDFGLEFLVMLDHVLGGERLVGEAHVHHRRGMAFGGGEIDEAAFAEQINLAAVLHGVFVDEGARGFLAAGKLFERGDIDLHVEVAGVADHRAIFHALRNARRRCTDLSPVTVTKMSPILAASAMGMTRKPSMTASSARKRIDFGDDHVGAQALGAHGHAASAPAVAGDDHAQAGEQQVGGAQDAVERGLAGAVAIVEHVLGLRVVDGDDRILQRAVLGHGAQADHAGGGLFGAADDVGNQFLALGEQRGDQVAAVVHGDLRLVVERGGEVRVIGGVVLTLDGEGGNVVVLHQGGGDFVLRGERIGGAEHHVGAAVAQRDGQVGGFAGDVQAGGNAQALERLLLDEALANQLQNGHLLIGPFDPALAGFGEGEVFYVASERIAASLPRDVPPNLVSLRMNC